MMIVGDDICKLQYNPPPGPRLILNTKIEDWLGSNNIKYKLGVKIIDHPSYPEKSLLTSIANMEFEKLEDEVAFKLRWL